MKSIKSKSEYKTIYKQGKRYGTAVGQIFVLPADEYKVGIVVNRQIGNAVKRNRIKRRIKEALRKQKIKAEILVKANKAVDNLKFQEIEEAIKSCIMKAKND